MYAIINNDYMQNWEKAFLNGQEIYYPPHSSGASDNGVILGTSKPAKFLKQRIIKEVPNLNSKSIKIKKINNKKTQVIMGPYKSINFLKNDYIKLNTFGFEEMDIFINE